VKPSIETDCVIYSTFVFDVSAIQMVMHRSIRWLTETRCSSVKVFW